MSQGNDIASLFMNVPAYTFLRLARPLESRSMSDNRCAQCYFVILSFGSHSFLKIWDKGGMILKLALLNF